jgi:hydrogenase maturation protein HypF
MTQPAEQRQHLSLHLQGLVQGVGLRPHVVRLAAVHGVVGTVANSNSGVHLELEGSHTALEAFTAQLISQPPKQARIDQHCLSWSPARGGGAGLQILPPQTDGTATALVSPDLAICDACLSELNDPQSRRFGYPFISCTDCGPRYSVVERLPFEREHTSFKALPLCPTCQAEYSNPSDRRCHAQTISCPTCGPQLLWNGAPTVYAKGVDAAATALRAGAIVAIKGVGGFQLLVNPANHAANLRLRQRKGRPHKPLALLANAHWLEQHCAISSDERALWRTTAAPILLVRHSSAADRALSSAVAGSSPWLGVMRPCNGLQQLLLDRCGGVLVATSANRSGEPICRDAITDGEQLEALADHVLNHSLTIVNRIDDSVVRWAGGGPLVLRLGRGLSPLALPSASPKTSGALALGAQIKGSLALQTSSYRLLSPDLGDLSSSAGALHHQHTFQQWLAHHGLNVSRLLCDQHSGYTSSQWGAELARSRGLPLQTVQHHHAHLLAVMAEHQLSAPALGVAWDGSGQGDDGSLWGGEALLINATGYQRIARLRPWALPGGERAQREPRRAALGLLLGAFGPQWRERIAGLPELAWGQAFSSEELTVLEQSVAHGINSPRCSSIGRLFDAVAALLNLEQRCSYEAQAAMALEALALKALEQPQLPTCRLQLQLEPGPEHLWQWNWRPLLEQLLEALAAEIPAEAIALGFHHGLANAIAALAKAQAAEQLLLAGGCFQNALLLELSIKALGRQGCEALWPQQLPCNDAALPIGQLLAAESMSMNELSPQAARHVPGRRR